MSFSAKRFDVNVVDRIRTEYFLIVNIVILAFITLIQKVYSSLNEVVGGRVCKQKGSIMAVWCELKIPSLASFGKQPGSRRQYCFITTESFNCRSHIKDLIDHINNIAQESDRTVIVLCRNLHNRGDTPGGAEVSLAVMFYQVYKKRQK